MNNKFSIFLDIFLLVIFVLLLSLIIFPKLLKTIEKSKLETFVANTQKLYRESINEYNKVKTNVIYNNGIGASTLNYNCNKIPDLSFNDKKIIYTISIDKFGNITNLAITNGIYEYIYEGNELNLEDITEDKVTNIKFGNTNISLSLCD